MSRYLIEHDGLFLGSSSACNLVACIKLVKKMGWKDGRRVVTILYAVDLAVLKLCADRLTFRCDSGSRHYSKVRIPLSS